MLTVNCDSVVILMRKGLSVLQRELNSTGKKKKKETGRIKSFNEEVLRVKKRFCTEGFVLFVSRVVS